MFCNNCGTPLAVDAAFCSNCGQPSPAAPPAAYTQPPPQYAAPPPQPQYAPPQPPPPPPIPGGTRTCEWCRAVVDTSQDSCPNCGATLGVRTRATNSQWLKLPGRKDMAKIHFGASVCQIEGKYVPVADMNLAATDSVYFSHHVILWKDPQVNVTTMPLKGAWKRMFAGMPLIMTQAQGPGHIAFSHDHPGELISLPLHPGQAIDVREHLFLVATHSVTYDWFDPGVWFSTRNGDDTETHYPIGMYMDRFMAPQGPGLLLLHAAGNGFLRELAPHQSILIKPSALIFKDPTVQMHLHFEYPSTGWMGWGRWGNRYLWLRLTGPGRVAVRSVFDKHEGEEGNIVSKSMSTETEW